MTPNQLNSLHDEYRHRFEIELDQLVQQSAFVEVVFNNEALLFADEQASFLRSLDLVFGSTFEGLALGLSRVWDARQNDPNLISIPNLVSMFSAHSYLGCRALSEGETDRAIFDTLWSDPMIGRLRTARTEMFAHSIQIGKSKDRKRSDVAGSRDLKLVNKDVLQFCEKTMNLLYALLCSLNISTSHKGKTLEDMRAESRKDHCSLLRSLVPSIVEP